MRFKINLLLLMTTAIIFVFNVNHVFADINYYIDDFNYNNTFSDNHRYMEVTEKVPVYDNRSGSLVKVGELLPGEEYRRYEASSSWHQVQFGDFKGYVRKEGTKISNGQKITNEIDELSTYMRKAETKERLTIYDNSTGNLEPIATVEPGVTLGVIEDYGGSWIYVAVGDRLGYIRTASVEELYVKIFLDPGHGGHDRGASGFGLHEKDVVLSIANYTKLELESKYSNVMVMMSRSTDKYVGLEDRAKMANRWGADYFISFHNNAFNGEASGFESFVHPTASGSTIEFQRTVHNSIVNKFGFLDRGKKEANFSVLRHTKMPALLIEYLFIDNSQDNSRLKQENIRKELGITTADSIADMLSLNIDSR